MIVEQSIIDFVAEFKKIVSTYIQELYVYSVYTRKGYKFRANANFLKNVWRDWALFDFGDEGQLPSHIMGFIDLSGMPANITVDYRGIDGIGKGIYAIVETGEYITSEDEINKSELFIPFYKTIEGYTGDFVSHRVFLLADCEAIVGPIAVVPDLGGQQNAYFQIKSRTKWKEDFIKWLNSSSQYDEIVSSDDENLGENQQANYLSDNNASEEEDPSDSEEEE